MKKVVFVTFIYAGNILAMDKPNEPDGHQDGIIPMIQSGLKENERVYPGTVNALLDYQSLLSNTMEETKRQLQIQQQRADEAERQLQALQQQMAAAEVERQRQLQIQQQQAAAEVERQRQLQIQQQQAAAAEAERQRQLQIQQQQATEAERQRKQKEEEERLRQYLLKKK